MKELQFIEGSLSKDFKADFESFIFNEEAHRNLQTPLGWHSFSLASGKKIMASIHLSIKDGLASSPHKAPFGSLQFSKKINPADLFGFLQQMEVTLKRYAVKKIRIKNPPSSYATLASPLLEVILLNLGYRIAQAEISTSIPVRETSFEDKIESWELRKLKQGKKTGLSFHEFPIEDINNFYSFISKCREERGHTLSMNLEEVAKTISLFPKSFHLFGVTEQKELAAASISIRVSKRILYNFYSAHPRKYDAISPVVTLMKGIYSWSRKHDVELIDLGTSGLENQPNFGLLDFKLRLGGQPSSKFTFEKDILS